MTTTTYEDTLPSGDILADGFLGLPDRYDLWLASVEGANNYVRVSPDSDNPTRFVVTGIPATIRPAAVALHLQGIAIWPHPDELIWDAVASLPRGTLLRGFRDGRMVRCRQMPHWSGAACIGWMREE